MKPQAPDTYAAVLEMNAKLDAMNRELERINVKMRALDELIEVLNPVGREAMNATIDKLAELEKKGVFRLLNGGAQLLERVAERYGQEEIDQLNENIVSILDTVKNATQPDVLRIANDSIDVLHDVEQRAPERIGLFGLLRATRDPDIQESLGALVELLRVMNQQRRSHAGEPSSN